MVPVGPSADARRWLDAAHLLSNDEQGNPNGRVTSAMRERTLAENSPKPLLSVALRTLVDDSADARRRSYEPKDRKAFELLPSTHRPLSAFEIRRDLFPGVEPVARLAQFHVGFHYLAAGAAVGRRGSGFTQRGS